MQPGWNPLRRNQKIGVPRAIGGADNKMVIPEGFLFNGPLSKFAGHAQQWLGAFGL